MLKAQLTNSIIKGKQLETGHAEHRSNIVQFEHLGNGFAATHLDLDVTAVGSRFAHSNFPATLRLMIFF